MEEYGIHKDLRDLGHRSVIPYVHGRACCMCVYVVQAVS
jgi:hypothetical protein